MFCHNSLISYKEIDALIHYHAMDMARWDSLGGKAAHLYSGAVAGHTYWSQVKDNMKARGEWPTSL